MKAAACLTFGDGHGEDHPDEQAADDMLGGLTQDDNDEG